MSPRQGGTPPVPTVYDTPGFSSAAAQQSRSATAGTQRGSRSASRFQVQVSKLRADADKWQDVAQTTSAAQAAARGLVLNDENFSCVGLLSDVAGSYGKIRQRVETLLGEATKVYGDLGATLDRVAAEYERNDQSGMRRYRGIWDPKSASANGSQ
jgi:hypothetical protein